MYKEGLDADEIADIQENVDTIETSIAEIEITLAIPNTTPTI